MSPFKSQKQMRYLAAKEPAVFKKWKNKYGVPKGLPLRHPGSKKRSKGKSTIGRQKGGVLR